jgi:hypothetical protein
MEKQCVMFAADVQFLCVILMFMFLTLQGIHVWETDALLTACDGMNICKTVRKVTPNF